MKLFLVFSHSLTISQKEDAMKFLNIEEFISLPNEIQKKFSNIPPEEESISKYVNPVKEFLKENAKKGDYVLVQGDFGAVVEIVNFSKSIELIPIYSTTKRDSIEKVVQDKVIKQSIFKHILFRRY
jgi:negative regulator of genetic competence, sporulation and motility